VKFLLDANTADSDSPTMLALHGAAAPSVVHLRHI